MALILRPEQKEACEFITHQEKVLLLADPGAGKTLTALSAVRDLPAKRWLVVAPRLVIPTAWEAHLNLPQFEWDYVIAGGTKKALIEENHRFYLVTTDSVNWLDSGEFDLSHIDGIIIDEIDKFKNHASKRTKALKRLSRQFKYRIGMTGTPCTKSLEQLFPQVFIIDRGQTLGTTVTGYRRKYFYQGGFKGYEWIPKSDALERITKAIRPVSHRMEVDSEEPTLNDVTVELPANLRKLYNEAKRKLRIEVGQVNRVVGEAGSAYSVMRQISAGAIYDEFGNYQPVHMLKLDRLKDLHSELQGKKILAFYWFKFEKELAYASFPKRRIAFLDSDTNPNHVKRILDDWANDKYDYLFCHPASAGHGIDGLQKGCRDIAWLTLPDDLSLYLQGNGRIVGKRAEGHIRVHHLLTKNSVDEVILRGLNNKDLTQKTVLQELTK